MLEPCSRSVKKMIVPWDDDQASATCAAIAGQVGRAYGSPSPAAYNDACWCVLLQVGAERYNLFKGCPRARTATMVLRGGSEQFIDEAERSLHDAIMIVRRAMKNASVVPGGGAIDMQLSRQGPASPPCLRTA